MTEAFTQGHALIIGVGADLPATVKDATALRDVLVDSNRAAYPLSQVELLTEANASRQHILEAFDRLINRVEKDSTSTVIIYFSGHGGRIEHADSSRDYYILPYGYNSGPWTTTAISADVFTSEVEAIKAQKLVVILDCCHAAAIPGIKAPGEVFIKSPVDLINMLGTGSGRVVIASSHEQEFSYTGTPYSVFTSCLLEAMAGKAAVNKDGYARILDVLIYLFDQVPKRAPGPQHPMLRRALDLGDNFPLCYYAGGSKTVAGTSTSNVPSGSAISAGQRRRLQQQLDGLQAEWDLRAEKVKRMRVALGIEDSVAPKFRLERQLLDEEVALASLSGQMEDVERRLAESS